MFNSWLSKKLAMSHFAISMVQILSPWPFLSDLCGITTCWVGMRCTTENIIKHLHHTNTIVQNTLPQNMPLWHDYFEINVLEKQWCKEDILTLLWPPESKRWIFHVKRTFPVSGVEIASLSAKTGNLGSRGYIKIFFYFFTNLLPQTQASLSFL